mmetsp:Transcript_62088/g.202621  ORF Transcript_62088/g.202621 Transcript_62088/m.202621 type:complete len:124 (+) Transcript_62088:188-559(+)
MVDLVHPRCKYGTQPIFGLRGDARPSCCAKCKLAEMVDMKSPRCGCGTHADFVLLPALRASHCRTCKIDSTVAVSRLQCEKCCKQGRRPLFGWPGDLTPSWCSVCKSAGMVDFRIEALREERA